MHSWAKVGSRVEKKFESFKILFENRFEIGLGEKIAILNQVGQGILRLRYNSSGYVK